ncbi:MAG: hypothetical protein KF814_12855 [Nitrospiraceae bacterium]|nr:hypothetical protein [Nitrospiraceae bacterium]
MTGFWEFLSRDIALFGGLHSPMLSWLGSCGLVVFFLWHVTRLTVGVSGIQRCYLRVHPTLSALAKARKGLQSEWLSIGALSDPKKQSKQAVARPNRIDLDDLQALDVAVRREPLLEQAWLHFRKTFVIERTAWFIEPRVFATRPAAEFFPRDLLNSKLNLAFYHQFPSLITGIGLLLTFLAILIGLSKLHADGSQIVGIQGLINGLAGKFLTSIVGLVCANLFVLLEKSAFHRLTTTQQEFLTMVDELFPRKTMEQMLENFTPAGQAQASTVVASSVPTGDLAERLAGTLSDRLTPTVSALRDAVEGLTRWEPSSGSGSQARSTEELTRIMQQTIAAPILELNHAIQALSRSVEELKLDREGKPRPHRSAAAPRQDARSFDESRRPMPEEMVTMESIQAMEPIESAEPVVVGQGAGEQEADEGMMGLRWFANWRQGIEAKGAV